MPTFLALVGKPFKRHFQAGLEVVPWAEAHSYQSQLTLSKSMDLTVRTLLGGSASTALAQP